MYESQIYLKRVKTLSQCKNLGINTYVTAESEHVNQNLYEPCHDKMCLRESPTRPDKNRPAQPQKLASLEISAIESRGIILSKERTTKALIRLRGCAFVVRI